MATKKATKTKRGRIRSGSKSGGSRVARKSTKARSSAKKSTKSRSASAGKAKRRTARKSTKARSGSKRSHH